ncbi:TiaS agmantine-binding domain-containing protein [Stetteria hydrogenophila]
MNIVTLAFDDVDSPDGGCTTHFAALFLVEASRLAGVELLDYPLLVRLNPGIPWKTRGNAAVAVRLLVERDPADLWELAVSMAEEYSVGRGWWRWKWFGVAAYPGEAWRDPRLRWLYRRALTGVVTRDVAENAARGARFTGGRGVVGALAALAALAPGEDYTFELTAYRQPWLWGLPRCVVEGGEALRVEAGIPACAFNNVSPEGRVVAAPRGPDPVLAGFRGDCPGYLGLYSRLLCEPPALWVLYRSNQHTDAHGSPLGEVRPYNAGRIPGHVAEPPERIPGGHVVVRLDTPKGLVDAAFYRETGPVARAASLLRPGDSVVVQGTVRPYAPRGIPTIAVDKLVVLSLAPEWRSVAPRCPRCGARMKSMGRGKGYRCPRCGYRDPHARPLRIPAPRGLSPGVYTPPPGWISHLTAPPWRRARRDPPRRPAWGEVLSTQSHPPVSSGAHQSTLPAPPHPPASSGPAQA